MNITGTDLSRFAHRFDESTGTVVWRMRQPYALRASISRTRTRYGPVQARSTDRPGQHVDLLVGS